MAVNNRRALVEPAMTATCLAVLTLWLFWPALGKLDTALIGDPRTDTIRGLWGLDHVWRSMIAGQVPWDSELINFPIGVRFMVLPMASSVLLAPLVGLVGPTAAWNLSMIVLIFALGLSVAWLTRLLTDKWTSATVAGALIIAQPMLHHAVADGTAEHIALWAIPLFLGATLLTLQEHLWRWGLLAGFLVLVIAIDSPYHGIYALVLGLFVCLPVFRLVEGRRRDQIVSLATLVAAGCASLGVLLLVYGQFDGGVIDGPTLKSLQSTNAIDLKLWWYYDGSGAEVRDPSRPPTVIPAILLIGTLILSLLGGRRALPWLLSAVVMLGLSLGLNVGTGTLLGAWFGAPFGFLADSTIQLNQHIYDWPAIGRIRFPRRWLVPAALALSVGSGIGLQAVYRRFIRAPWIEMGISLLLAGLVVLIGTETSRIHRPFPTQSLPDIAFADWIQEQPEEGAILLLPAVRTVEPGTTREQLPVFANLHALLASADDLYLQVKHRRPTMGYPNLQTLSAAPHERDVQRVLRDWSDLSQPKTAGRAVPPSAIDPGADRERRRGLDALTAAGLRWIAVDRGAYDDDGLTELRRQLGQHLLEENTFSEGDGVIVITIE